MANTAITNAAPPKTAAQLQKEQLAAAAKNLKNQILARSASAGAVAGGSKAATASSGRLSAASSAGGKREVKTLDEYLAGAPLWLSSYQMLFALLGERHAAVDAGAELA